MKVREIVEKLELKILAGEKGIDKDVKGVYINDLLSWVMSHGDNGNAWITVQIHPNIVAVASLLEFSCIIVPEGLEIEKVTADKANEEKISILQAKESGYELCCKLKVMGV